MNKREVKGSAENKRMMIKYKDKGIIESVE